MLCTSLISIVAHYLLRVCRELDGVGKFAVLALAGAVVSKYELLRPRRL
jgi:hypothetical protein